MLKIISPEKTVYSGEVENVLVPGTLGEFEILNDHAPIISTLENGRVAYVDASGRHQFNIQGGFVEVKRNNVSLCVEL